MFKFKKFGGMPLPHGLRKKPAILNDNDLPKRKRRIRLFEKLVVKKEHGK